MNTYTVDVYAVVTLVIRADSEAHVRKFLHTDDGQEMYPTPGGSVELTNVCDLPVPVKLTSASFRKVWALPEAADEHGNPIETTYQPGDGAVNALEAAQWPEYCATADCAELLDDGEGYDGYCGTCADRREAAGLYS
ncbi:hypothetical protein [Nocardia terpenica]|uniref:Uncharacterized protein n=1 Tax=Nocardia terpenica TaxID=455432 RepID=A0A291RY95_9NOCA|nr:hypothetical protein [Nocardia terpenica]ATL72506.1 hypothetical protein CRH09_39730 [Nocardia terpenica]